MKILLLSDINSAHTQKWAMGLSQKGIEIAIFSISKPQSNWYLNYSIQLLSDSCLSNNDINAGAVSKLGYIKLLPSVKKAIKKFEPNIVHAHYASSYGLLGALSKFKPFVLSVWGSDVYDFPRASFLNKLVLKYNLKKASQILSTSHAMAIETAKYTKKKIEITPFGIDLTVFKPNSAKSLFNEGDIVIGIIKSLEEKYGIDYLLKAFKILKNKHSNLPLKLLIVGEGSQRKALENLSKELDIQNEISFTGKVKQEEVPNYHNMLSVYVGLSVLNSESFGVAVIEASACEKPVIVSDVDGFKEVVKDGYSGIIVPKCNVNETVLALEKIILDKNYAIGLGKNGRIRVTELYNWNNNVQTMIDIYNNINSISN